MRIFLVISLLISVHCGAQQTEYWLGFSENSTPSSEDKIKVIISSASAISGDVSIPAAGWSSEFVVPAGASSQLEIPVNLAEITTDNIPHPMGILVRSSAPAFVQAITEQDNSADVTSVRALHDLGNRYRIQLPSSSVSSPSSAIIVATAHNTQIEIDAAPGSGLSSSTITLDEGMCYRISVAAGNDLTGTVIQGASVNGDCRNFAVFVASKCASVPSGCAATCDHLYEQISPIDSWGTQYYVSPFLFSQNPLSGGVGGAYTYRVMADQPGTTVVIDAAESMILDAGEFVEFNDQVMGHCINASAPVHVIQLMQGISCSGNGDPSLIEVRPVSSWQQQYSFHSSSAAGISEHYLKITVSAAGLSQCNVDGALIEPNLFTAFPACPGLFYINYEVNEGYHRVNCSTGFSVVCYSVGSTGNAASVSHAFSPVPTSQIETPWVDDSFCSGNSISINLPSGFNPVAWYLFPDTINVLSNAASLELTPPIVAGLYVANTTDNSNGCIRQFRYSVAAPGNLNVSINPAQINACKFQEFAVEASAIPFSSALIYDWSPADGLSDSHISNPQIIALETVVYEVSVSTPDGCLTGSAPLPVIVSDGSVAALDILEENVVICTGESEVLNVRAEEYVWEDNFDPSISWGDWSSVSGGEDNNACGVISGGALYFNSYPPREAVTQPMTIGGEGFVHFTIKIADGMAPCDDAEPGDNVQLSFSVDNGPWQIFETLYEYAYPEFTEVVVPIPILAQTGSVRFRWSQMGMFTQGEDNWILENVFVTRTMLPASLSWTPTGGITLNGTLNPSVSPVSNTTYEVTYNDAASGCQYRDEVHVEVGGNYNLVMSEDTLLCGTANVELYAGADSGIPLQYHWSPSSGLSGDNIHNPICSPTANTAYTVTVMSEDGCSQQGQVNVALGPEIAVSLSASDSIICEGETVALQLQSDFSGALNCLWSGAGTISGVDVFTQSVGPNSNTEYICRVEDLVSGCGVSDTLELFVTPEFFITVSPGFIVNCAAPGVQIEASSTASVPVSWSWSPASSVDNADSFAIELLSTDEPILAVIAETDEGCTAEASVSLIVSQFVTDLGPDVAYCEDELYELQTGWPSSFDFAWSNGGTTPSIIVQNTGEYSVTVTSADGCESSDTIFIEELEYPQISLPDDTIFCAGGSVRLVGGPFGYNYEWSTGESSRVIDVNETGVYTVLVSNGDCQSADTVSVGVRPNPLRVLPADEVFCFGLGVPLQLDAGNVGSTFLWDDGNDMRVREILSAGMYNVVITTPDSCQAIQQIEVTESCPNTLFVPNTFTPDNDGINDVWRIYGQNIVDYRVQVFSRYGTVIFLSDDINEVWTGSVMDGDYYVDGGVYAYVIRYKHVGENGFIAGEEYVRGYVRVAR